MSLEHAILGFLGYHSFSGYELKRIFDSSVQHFWSADQSQIYRTLARLSERGLAVIEVVEQSDRPDRKVYHITDEGREELRKWLAGPFPMEASHSGPLVQVFFMGKLSNEEALAKFEEAADIFRKMLHLYEAVPARTEYFTQIVGSPREAYYWYSTLDMGILTMKAQLTWAEKVIEDIKNGNVPEATPLNQEIIE